MLGPIQQSKHAIRKERRNLLPTAELTIGSPDIRKQSKYLQLRGLSSGKSLSVNFVNDLNGSASHYTLPSLNINQSSIPPQSMNDDDHPRPHIAFNDSADRKWPIVQRPWKEAKLNRRCPIVMEENLQELVGSTFLAKFISKIRCQISDVTDFEVSVLAKYLEYHIQKETEFADTFTIKRDRTFSLGHSWFHLQWRGIKNRNGSCDIRLESEKSKCSVHNLKLYDSG